MSLFLSNAELDELVGSAQNGARKRWLINHGWAFSETKDGKVRVARDEFRYQMVTGGGVRKGPRSSEPDLEGLRALR